MWRLYRTEFIFWEGVGMINSKVWIMITEKGWYPIEPSEECKPEDHAKLNEHVIRIEDMDGIVLWSKQNESKE